MALDRFMCIVSLENTISEANRMLEKKDIYTDAEFLAALQEFNDILSRRICFIWNDDKQAADTNANDLVRMELSVNGKFYRFKQANLNTQLDLDKWREQCIGIIRCLQLDTLSRAGNPPSKNVDLYRKGDK